MELFKHLAFVSLGQNVQEGIMNIGVAPQYAVSARKDRGIGMAFTHPPLPDFSWPVSEAMMRTVAHTHSRAQIDCRILVVTGWNAADRSADLSLQMARGLASLSQESVLLVDADFHTPLLHRDFQTAVTSGLAELIAGSQNIQEVVRPVVGELLYFLPTGNAAALGSTGLSAPACAETLSMLRLLFHRVVIHVGPLLENASAMVIAAEGDAVVLALAAGLRTRDEVEILQHQITSLRAKLFGAVLTEIPAKKTRRGLRWLR